MTLAEQIVTDLATILNTDEFAESVTYNGSTITADVQVPADPETAQPMGAARTAQRALLHVKASDVAAPAYNDPVVIGSDTWRVVHVPGRAEGGLWALEIESNLKPVP